MEAVLIWCVGYVEMFEMMCYSCVDWCVSSFLYCVANEIYASLFEMS